MKNIRASIDIGSNSTLLLIFDISKNEVLCEKSEITSLGKDLDQNLNFREDTMDATFQTLRLYVKKCDEFNIKPSEIIATATEASRVARNSFDFYTRVKNKLELEVQLISGEAEAYYTALGVAKMSKLNTNEATILDVGGASSEIIKINFNPFKIISTISLPVGSVRAADWVSENSFEKKLKNIFDKYSLFEYECDNLICVAGTLTTLALILNNSHHFDAMIVNKLQSDIESFKKFLTKLKNFDDDDFLKFNFVGKRKNTLYAGALTSLKIIEKIKVKNISFSTYGLRYGTLISGKIDERFRI